MTIKNIVLSGGCHTLYQSLGIIQTLVKNDVLKIDNIEKIYGTSAGALLGAILCLKFEWDILNEYFLNRPWHDVYNIDINTIFSIFNKKGFFNRNQIELSFKPLLHAKDLDLNITLKEFYEYSNIELYVYSFDINYFKLEEISYKTNPDLSLITALYMSCALPILFSPVCIDDKCYIDGGFVTNYPLNFCIQQTSNLDEILGIKNVFDCQDICQATTSETNKSEANTGEANTGEANKSETNKSEVTTGEINDNSSLFDFFITFFQKAVLNLQIDKLEQNIKHEINCQCRPVTYTFFNQFISSYEVRKQLLENGIECASQYIQKLSDENVNHDTNDKK